MTALPAPRPLVTTGELPGSRRAFRIVVGADGRAAGVHVAPAAPERDPFVALVTPQRPMSLAAAAEVAAVAAATAEALP